MNKKALIILPTFFAFFITLSLYSNDGAFFSRNQGPVRLTISFILQAPNVPFTINITANNVKDLKKKYKLILDNTLSAYLCFWTKDSTKYSSSFEDFYSGELPVDSDIQLFSQEDPQIRKKAFIQAFQQQLPNMLKNAKTNQSGQSAPDTDHLQTEQSTTPVSSEPLAHQK